MTPPPISKGSWKWIGTVAKPEMPCYLRSSDPEECWVGVALDGFTDNPANAQAIAALPQLLAVLELSQIHAAAMQQDGRTIKERKALAKSVHETVTAALLAAGYTL
jgi:hypothetical protein